MILLNAFSANMLAVFPSTVTFEEVTAEEARIMLMRAAEADGGAILSAVGHADTAAVYSAVLGVTVPTNRATVTLRPGDEAVVGQYSGPRLQEGATTLPDGATIRWLRVRVGGVG